MGAFLQDVRHGLRILLRNRGFGAAAILTLALGIGANTSIFSVVRAVLLRPLPYADPDRLLDVHIRQKDLPEDRSSVSEADFQALSEESRSLDSMAAYYAPGGGYALAGTGTPEQVQGTQGTAALFATLGTQAALGRTFLPEDARPESPAVVVLGHGLWTRRFGADPGIIGRGVTIDGRPHTVIGVLPAGFAFPRASAADLYPIARLDPATARRPFYLRIVARPRTGAGEQEVASDLARVTLRIRETYPDSASDWTIVATPLKETLIGGLRPALAMLLGAVSLVLLIASANLASLLLARAAARRKEMAIRAALGAGRARLARLALAETLVLAATGGGLGVLLSVWLSDLIVAFAPADLPRLGEVRLDGEVLLYTLVVTVVSGLLAGLAPALASSRLDLMGTLREAGRGLTDRAGGRLRRLLVLGEFGLAVMLLCGAALLLNSFARLQHVSPGFDPEGLLTMRISLPEGRYADDASRAAFFRALLQATGRLPGVRSSAVTMALPPNLLVMTNPYTVEGRPAPPGQSLPAVAQLMVSPAYFTTLGVPLLTGRFFTDADAEGRPPVMLINEAMARRVFPGEDPVGRRMQLGDPDPQGTWTTVIGVVGDVKYTGLDAPPEPTMYTSFYQDLWWPSMFLVLRTEGDPGGFTAAVRASVRTLDSDLPVAAVSTMDGLLRSSVAQPRFRTTLLGIFAAVAIALAAIGAYGLLSYAVGQRTQEIGIRMALGARRLHILRLVIGDGLRLALAGTVLGLLGALALSRALTGLLFGVTATDPWTYLGVGLVILGVALLASWLPARRATSIDPVTALRSE